MDKAQHLLGMAYKAGKAIAGEEATESVIHQTDARLLLLSKDASERSVRTANAYAEEGSCLLVTTPYSREELGLVTGRKNCVLIALTDLGFALAVASAMQESFPGEDYSSLIDRLTQKMLRAVERKAHPRNRVKEPKVKEVKEKRVSGLNRSHQKKTVAPRERFANSRPVHKGKGSVKKSK